MKRDFLTKLKLSRNLNKFVYTATFAFRIKINKKFVPFY